MVITFEGIDGSGKSTQVDLLAEWLRMKGKKVATFREPGGTIITEKIRTILLTKGAEELSDKTELLLFLAARNHLITTKLIPLLETDTIVVLDRFSDSTLAYQGYGRGIDLDVIQQLLKFSVNQLVPSVTFYIDMCFTDAVNRLVSSTKKLDRFESLGEDFFDKVRNGYIELQKNDPNRILSISGNKTIEEIHSFVTKELERKFSSLI